MDEVHAITRADELAAIVGRDNVSVADNADAAHRYKRTCGITVTPEQEEHVAALLKWASERGVPVIPQGGGTKDALGHGETREAVLVSMRKMSGVLHHSVGDLMVTALPGTTLQQLQDVLGRKGQFLPLDPSWPEQATLGGIAAANSSGPKRAMYGTVRDHLLASRVACTDGKIIRTGAKVVKNVAGYDMNKLFIGAMGTLGVFTELTFKVRPMPSCTGLLMFVFTKLDQLIGFQRELLHSHLEPCAVEVVGAGTQGALAGGLLEEGQAAIFVLFEDVESSVRYQMERVQEWAARLGMGEIRKFQGRENTEPVLDWMREVIPNSNQVAEDETVIGMKLLSMNSEVPSIHAALLAKGRERGLRLLLRGGICTGISHMRLQADSMPMEEVAQWVEEVRHELKSRGGRAVVEFAPQSIRSAISIWGDRSEADEIMRGIKIKFDSNDILNSGRYAGGI